jgi:hypothetical protein
MVKPEMIDVYRPAQPFKFCRTCKRESAFNECFACYLRRFSA